MSDLVGNPGDGFSRYVAHNTKSSFRDQSHMAIIIMKSLDTLRAKKIFIRKKNIHKKEVGP